MAWLPNATILLPTLFFMPIDVRYCEALQDLKKRLNSDRVKYNTPGWQSDDYFGEVPIDGLRIFAVFR